MAIKVLLVGEKIDELEKISKKLVDDSFEIVGASMDLSNISDEIFQNNPDVVIMSCSDLSWVFRACQKIYLLHPSVVTVMVSDEKSYDIVKKSIDAGATAYISLSEPVDKFNEELKKVYFNEKSRRKMIVDNSSLKRNAEIITVFGTKGGMGKTALAVNLAVELSKKKAKVAFLDLDLMFGDAHTYLGLEAKETIVELLQERKIPTIDSIRSYFVSHSSGLQLLCAPSSPEYSDSVSGVLIEPIINALRTHFDYIVIDTNVGFSDLNVLILEESSTILYFTGLDISILNNSKKGLMYMNSINVSEKVKLVIGKSIKGDITKEDVENIMNKAVFASISEDYEESVKALNEGVPIVTSNSKLQVAKDIIEIADSFNSSEVKEDEESKNSIFSKLNFSKFKFGGKK